MAENQNIVNEHEKIPTEQELNEQMAIRRSKLSALCEQGKNPFELVKYPVDNYSIDIKENFEALEEKQVIIAGRLMSKRIMGKASFAHIRDNQGDIQLVTA